MVDGSLLFDTKVNTGGFNRGVKSISGAIGSLKSQFVRLGTAIGLAFGVSQLVSFGKQAIETASDITEVQNVVDTAFGSMSNKMEDFANTAVDTFGISKLTAKQTGSTFMAMAKGMGIAQDNASDMALSLTGLSADMASFYNVEQSVASTALKSVFTGETETLKQFGIVMTEANLEAYALSQGITKSISNMSQAEKVQLRYNYVMQQTSLAQGDFAKTQDSWANQTRILSERWKEFSGTVGTLLMNTLLPAVKLINNALSTLIDYANRAVTSLSKIFGWEIETSNATTSVNKNTQETADNLNKSTNEQNNLTKAVNKTNKATKKQNKELKDGLASYDELNVMAQSNNTSDSTPSSSTSQDSVDPVSTLYQQQSKNDKKDNLGKELSNNIKTAFQDLYKKSGLEAFFANIQKGINTVNWRAIGDKFRDVFKSLKPIATTSLKGVLSVGKSFMSALGSNIGGLVSVCGKALQTAVGGIALWLSNIKYKVIGFITDISDNLTIGFNNLSTFFQNVFGIIGGSIDRVRVVMETSISNMLSGITNFVGAIGIVVSSAFNIITESLVAWTEKDGATIGTFFDTIQFQISDVMNTIGTIFNDIGSIIYEWWNGEDGGAVIFKNICDMFTNVGTTLMNVYNEWIKPVWDFVVDTVLSAWNNAIKPVFTKVINYIGKVANLIADLWNNYLSPIVNLLVEYLKPIIVNVLKAIKGFFDTVFTGIGDILGGFIDILSGLIDFITGVFTGDWKKAWNGIKTIFKGVWDAFFGIVKVPINLIIDGINLLWSGIYSAVKGIVDGIGGIAGAIGDLFGQDWHFSMPSEPPLIPKLATGTVVPASYGEYLAVLGDNKREPEVVSPLSTMKQAFLEAMNESGGFSGGDINLTVTLDGAVVYKNVVKHNNQDRKRRGKSQLA